MEVECAPASAARRAASWAPSTGARARSPARSARALRPGLRLVDRARRGSPRRGTRCSAVPARARFRGSGRCRRWRRRISPRRMQQHPVLDRAARGEAGLRAARRCAITRAKSTSASRSRPAIASKGARSSRLTTSVSYAASPTCSARAPPRRTARSLRALAEAHRGPTSPIIIAAVTAADGGLAHQAPRPARCICFERLYSFIQSSAVASSSTRPTSVVAVALLARRAPGPSRSLPAPREAAHR